jgi:S-formylglutathione hydrolase
MPSSLTLDELSSPFVPGPVPYAAVRPDSAEPLPLCLFLFGPGATRDALALLQPSLDAWWAEGSIPAMTIVTPTPRLDYYIEEANGGTRWDSFFTQDFVPHLHAASNTSETVIAGISGGGYGALKAAFAHPHLFRAVAAMQPMLEPALRESDVGPRNRLHHAGGGPADLIGENRDGAIWEANNPANLARKNATAIRDSGLATYIETGDHDFLNAHDGAEFLHRTLWDLDLSHEYHLVRGADHGGPTMRPRLRAMLAWFAKLWTPPATDAAAEKATAAWLQAGMQGPPPAGATATNAFLEFLRARFEPLRNLAAEKDPAAVRLFGLVR